MNTRKSKPRFVVCINNEGYPASLEKRKIYQMLPDAEASAHKLIRIVDETGEDYLYPMDWFMPITLSPGVVKALALAV